ncbi:MAG: hypothetical protein ABIH39_01970 [Candidatus Margulisiibacteriota bacterium]
MKKTLITCLILVFVVCLPSFALLSAGILGANYSFTSESATAFGVEVGVPFSIIPMAKTNIQVLTGTYSGASFMPIAIQQSFSLPFIGGLYGGVEVGYISIEVQEQTGGILMYGGFAGCEFPLGMAANAFVEASYDIIPLSQIDSGTKDETILVLKGGARIGL